MSKIDEVRSAMVQAMKPATSRRRRHCPCSCPPSRTRPSTSGADLTEEEETQVILKEIKQTKETLEMTPADRTDIIEECNHRLSVLEQYAPADDGRSADPEHHRRHAGGAWHRCSHPEGHGPHHEDADAEGKGKSRRQAGQRPGRETVPDIL